MTTKPVQDVRPGDWLIEHAGEGRKVSRVEWTERGVTITAPPNPPTPHSHDEVVVVASEPPTCKATWDEDHATWLVVVYVPEGTKVSVGMERDRRDEGDGA